MSDDSHEKELSIADRMLLQTVRLHQNKPTYKGIVMKGDAWVPFVPKIVKPLTKVEIVNTTLEF